MSQPFNFSSWYDTHVSVPLHTKAEMKIWLEESNIIDLTALSAFVKLDPDRLPNSFGTLQDKKSFITTIENALDYTVISDADIIGRGKTNSSSGGGANKWSRFSVEERIATATQLKQKGNARFQGKAYERAHDMYMTAIDVLTLKKMAASVVSEQQGADIRALLVSLHGNNAQVHIKMEQWNSAINSATVVLQHEPYNVKAIYRRSVAYFRSNRLDDARNELTRVLELDPSNAAAKKELQEVHRAIKDGRSKEKAVYSNLFSRGVYDDKEEERQQRLQREKELAALEADAWAESNAARASRGLPEQSLQIWRDSQGQNQGVGGAVADAEAGLSEEEGVEQREVEGGEPSQVEKTKSRRRRKGRGGGGDPAQATSTTANPNPIGSIGRSLEEFFNMDSGQQVDSVTLLKSLQQAQGVGQAQGQGQGTTPKAKRKSAQATTPAGSQAVVAPASSTGSPSTTGTVTATAGKAGQAVVPSSVRANPSPDSLSSMTIISMGGGPVPKPPPRDPRKPGKHPNMSRLSLLMVDAVSTLPAIDCTDPAALSSCLRRVQAGVTDIRSADCMEGVDAHLSSITGKIKTILRLEQNLVTAPITGPAKATGSSSGGGSGSKELSVRKKPVGAGVSMTGPTFNYAIECEFELCMRPVLACIGNEAVVGTGRSEDSEVSVVSMRTIIAEDAKAIKQKSGKPPAHKPLFAVKPGTSEVTKAPVDPTPVSVPLLTGTDSEPDPAIAALNGVVRRYRGVITFSTSLIADCIAESNPHYVPINSQVACTKVTVRHYKQITNPQVELRLNEAVRLMERKIINKMIEYDHVCRHI